MTPINKKRLAVGLFSVSCLNFSFISTYPISRAFANDERFSSELFQSAGLDRFQVASRPPWEQPPGGTSSYVLPPWGLTVNDFVVTRQMPLSSGRREVLLSSPSTGSEQRLFINLPSSGDFQLYEMAFNRVLVSGSDSLFSEPETRAKLQNFNVKFSNNALSEVVLADGTNARFTADTAVIKSSSGETIETFRLQRNAANLEGTLVAVRKTNDQSIYSGTKSSGQQDPLSDGLVLAQSQNSCEENTQRSMDGISNSMAPWSSQMSSSSSELVRSFGWTIGHGSETLKNSGNLSDSRLPELTCRPPVQCEERRVSGGSEIRTDLFDIPQGASGGEVVLTYEFFTIPDSIEMYFDGGRVLSVGPVSGQGSRTFRLPANAQQVGITLKGNDNVNTQWWYTISCNVTEPKPSRPEPSRSEPRVYSLNPSAENLINRSRLVKKVGIRASSGSLSDIGDFCIVEKIELADASGNPISLASFPQPWDTMLSPAYVATWGTGNIICNTIASYQNTPLPGGIQEISISRATFLDAHGIHPIQQNDLTGLPLYLRQEYYWYYHGDNNLKPLLTESGKHFTNLIGRRVEAQEYMGLLVTCPNSNPLNPFHYTNYHQHVEVFDISEGDKRSIGSKEIGIIYCSFPNMAIRRSY